MMGVNNYNCVSDALIIMKCVFFFFFFQAEDGIRDKLVTGVQTCALPISSKVVRLATRDLGVHSAIAKGALRPKSRFGAGLELLSEGMAQLYFRETRELHTLGAFDLVN